MPIAPARLPARLPARFPVAIEHSDKLAHPFRMQFAHVCLLPRVFREIVELKLAVGPQSKIVQLHLAASIGITLGCSGDDGDPALCIARVVAVAATLN